MVMSNNRNHVEQTFQKTQPTRVLIIVYYPMF